MNFLENGVATGGDALTGSGASSLRSCDVLTWTGIVAIQGAVGGLRFDL